MILLVEDDNAVAEVVRLHLELAGYTVRRAACPHEGLQMATETSPSVVVLDYSMPGMNGHDWLRRAREQGVDSPVVSLTADVDAWTEDDARDLGISRRLLKPVRRNDLLDGVARASGERELVPA